MGIRVIIMDVDGTLYNSRKKIMPKTREALLKVQEQGARLVVASGRPTSGLTDIVKELRMDDYHGLLVAYNGSRVVDCQTGEILFNQAMSVEEGRAVLEHMKRFDEVIPMIDRGEYMYVNNVYKTIQLDGSTCNIIERECRSGKFLLCEKEDLTAFADVPLNKILTAASPEYLQEHYREMMEPFADRLNCVFTARFYFEFTAKGIDKAKALDTVLRPMGYRPEEMIAFGDGQNDASMVKYAGIGVAMENAVQELKDAADEETLSCDADGIAWSLKKHMGIDVGLQERAAAEKTE